MGEEYKKKCGGGPPDKDKCPAINGIKRVNTSCADEETWPGGKCKLECEESGVQLGVGHEMHAHLVCEKKGGGVSWFTMGGEMITVEKLRSMEMCPLAGKCPPLKGIESVKTSCASGPTAPGGQCQLECEQSGLQLTDESFANLFCKEDENGPSWYKENGRKVTLKKIKNMDLCNANVCPIILGIENVKTNCSSEPSRKGDICLLECEETGQEITEKEYKKLK